MTPTPEQIAEVRRTWPAWDDATIRRHLQQRAELVAYQERKLVEAVQRALMLRGHQ